MGFWPDFPASAPSYYNLNPGSLPRWRAAMAGAYNGNMFAHAVFYGDSIMGGFTTTQNTTDANQANVYGRGVPGRIRALMQQLTGVGGDGVNWMFGSAALTATQTYSDPRIAITGTVTEVNLGPFGKCGLQVLGSANSFTFTPNGPFDTVVVYYLTNTGLGGPFTVQIGTDTASTVTPATTTKGTATATVTAVNGYGNYPIKIAGTGASAGTQIVAIKTTMGSSGVLTSVCQLNGQMAKDLTQSSVAGNNTDLHGSINLGLGLFVPDLAVICYGVNDWANQVTIASYKSDMQALITKLQGQLTDVMIVVPPWYNSTAGPVTQEMYRQALYDLADTNNCALVDIQKRWQTYSNGNLYGLYTASDPVHPSYAGYYDISTAVYGALTYHLGSAMPMRSIQGLPPVTNAINLSKTISASNTTTETTITSYVMQANSSSVGTQYSYKITGTIDNVVTAAPVITFRVKLGSTVLASIAITASATASTNRPFCIEGVITVRSTGAAGTIVGSMQLTESTTAVGTNAPKVLIVYSQTLTAVPASYTFGSISTPAINTTIANTLSLTMQWGTASASNVARAEVGNIILDRL
jgi:lysophospholipase L1-like esterase